MSANKPKPEATPKSPGPLTVSFVVADPSLVAPDAIPPRLSGYEILSEIGRGGMGIVYRAVQLATSRPVALKVMLDLPAKRQMPIARFHTEAAIARLLHHPNIVEVVDVGDQNGCLFIAMELVDGVDLARKLSAGRLDQREAARIAVGICAAIHYAHKTGVVHRDLKPANILIASDGTPKVSDFGLAKIYESGLAERGQTTSGMMIGTVGYMAPEQLLGHGQAFSPTADIYGIGCLLYEMITGQRPVLAKTVGEALRMAEDTDPVPPRELNPEVDATLSAICLKCLCKKPEDRYATADELRLDLHAFSPAKPSLRRGARFLRRLAAGLNRTPHPNDYRSWSKLLVWIAVLTLATQIIQFILRAMNQPPLFDSLVRAVELAAIWGILRRFGSFAPRSASVSQHQIATICVGFIFACSACAIGHWLRGEVIADPAMYVEWCTLSGFLFVVVGRLHWGWFYASAIGFFMLAALASLFGSFIVLVFGLVWAGSLLAAARRIHLAFGVAKSAVSLEKPIR